jgi:predicted glutamine amidotransferase
MCVIAIKDKGVDFPSADSINAMWTTNSDGAGFMYTLDDKVYIEKGFMKLKDFTRAISDLSVKLKKDGIALTDLPMVLHFRITTHGGTSPQLTHPFPISSKEHHLKALDLTCDLGLAHNGIISSVGVQAGLSDTAVYIKDVLTPLANLSKDFYMTKEGQSIMDSTIGASKFAFLDKKGNIVSLGLFKNGTKHGTEKVLFSNLSHEWDYAKSTSTCYTTPYKSSYSYGYDYSGYDTFIEDVSVKRIPAGVIIANDNDFFGGKELKFSSRVISETDEYYIDAYDIIYKGYMGNSDNIFEVKYFNVLLKEGKEFYEYMDSNDDMLKDLPIVSKKITY